METAPELSVIVVSYNVRPLLAECLASVTAETEAAYEIIVVDNASSDDSVEAVRMLAGEDGRIRLVANRENRGFAAANNQGLRLAKGRFVVLLNPDTVVLDGALDTLLAFMRNTPAAGAVGPVIVDADRTTVQYFCGRSMPTPRTEFYRLFRLDTLFRHSREFGRYLMTDWDHRSTRRVEVLMGACMMIRKEAVDEVGDMDEDMFMFADDVEYCYRIRRTGREVWLCADAMIVHYMGRSCATNFDRSYLVGIESMNVLFRKYYGSGAAAAYRMIIFAAYALRLVAGLAGADRAKVRLYARVLRWSVYGKLE